MYLYAMPTEWVAVSISMDRIRRSCRRDFELGFIVPHVLIQESKLNQDRSSCAVCTFCSPTITTQTPRLCAVDPRFLWPSLSSDPTHLLVSSCQHVYPQCLRVFHVSNRRPSICLTDPHHQKPALCHDKTGLLYSSFGD